MKDKYILLILTTILMISHAKSIKLSPSKLDLACKNVNTTALSPNCYVDLTIGIDMSAAMKSETNIATLVDQVLNLLTNYYQYYTNTAVVAFGDAGIDASDYFRQYEDVCEYIHDQEANSDNLGIKPKNLSQVFEIYRDKELYHNRGYQQVFLLFTAITDETNINNAVTVANQIRSQGVQVIVVVLNTPSVPSTYSNIADKVFSVQDFNIGGLIPNIVTTTCQNAGVIPSVDSPTSTPSNPQNPLSNGLGTPCAQNLPKAWLDIILVVDVSIGMEFNDLENLGASIATALYKLNISQGAGDYIKTHTSRIGLITFNNISTVQFDLKSANGLATLMKLKNLGQHATDITGGDVQSGLKAAYNMFQQQKSFRKRVVILVAATYKDTGDYDASQVANQLKEDQVTLIVDGYESSDGVPAPESLFKLSSQGYAYNASDSDALQKMWKALPEINCFCPTEMLQFMLWNEAFKNYTLYGDCLRGAPAKSIPFFISCSTPTTVGVLATVTSQEKLDFIIDKVIAHDFPDPRSRKNFYVGAQKQNGIWYWPSYNDTMYPFGDFPHVYTNNGDYGYFNNTYGFRYDFNGGGDTARSYVCQYKACDTDYFCNA